MHPRAEAGCSKQIAARFDVRTLSSRLVATAFLVGLWVTLKLARRTGLNTELVTNLVVYSALSGMLGAKVLMILFDWDHFSANPGEIFSLATLQAAGVYQGGLILAI